MRRDLLLFTLRAAAGLLVGLAVWSAFEGPYNRVLAGLAEPLLHATERPNATRLRATGSTMTIDRTDFRRGSARPALVASQLTVNFMFLMALFATNRRSMETQNVVRLGAAAVLLLVVHVLAVFVNVHAIYALQLGPWSGRHYGVVARNAWSAAAHFYTLVGSFGAAFILWWLLSPEERRMKIR